MPPKKESRMEVAEKLIDKSLSLQAQGYSIEKVLFFTAPLCQSFIAYSHPTMGVKIFKLNFDYSGIKNQDELLNLKIKNCKLYNKFLGANALGPISEKNIQLHLNWFKNTWFMQLVIELTSGEREFAIRYLKTVDIHLKLHAMSLAGKPDLNLRNYFQAWGGPSDLIIINSLKPIYPKLDEILNFFKDQNEALNPSAELALRRACRGLRPENVIELGNQINIVNCLIQCVRDINAVSPSTGMTALHYAVTATKLNEQASIIQMLIEAEANCDIPDKKGKSAKDYALESNNDNIKKFFNSTPIAGM